MAVSTRTDEQIQVDVLEELKWDTRVRPNDIEVRLPSSAERTDADLAKAALNALRWEAGVSADKLDVTVSHGWVTLKGEVNTASRRDWRNAL